MATGQDGRGAVPRRGGEREGEVREGGSGSDDAPAGGHDAGSTDGRATPPADAEDAGAADAERRREADLIGE
jgi:hypothetical protein